MRRAKSPLLGLALDAALPEPLHRQIGEQLRLAILERRLAPGTRLPSSRLMASELECARGTVLLALDQLVAEGYLVARAASGLFVADNLPDEMLVAPDTAVAARTTPPPPPVLSKRMRKELARPLPSFGDAPLAFPTGQPDRSAFPFALWAKLLEKEWRRPDWNVASAHEPFGHPELRAAIARHLAVSRGFTCASSSIVVTTGMRQGLSLLARTVLDPGEQAWIEEPGFVGTREALALAEIEAVPVPIDQGGFSLDVAQKLAPKARLAVVAPSHQFPLGAVLGLPQRLELLSWAARTGNWIAEDDFDGEYRYAGRPLAPLRALDKAGRVAYLGSFSKLLFPALRLSFIVLPDALVPAAERLMGAVSTTRASLLGQGALARFIADGHLAAHLRRTRPLYAVRQQKLIAALDRHLGDRLETAPDQGGMHLIVRPTPAIADQFDDIAVTANAAARGLAVAPLSACYAGRRKRHGLLLGYAGTPDDEIEPACRVLSRVLRD